MDDKNVNTGFFSKNNDLRNRIFFTIGILCIYRLGTYIPLSGIDPQSLQTLMQSNQKGLLGMFNVFSGGAVQRMVDLGLKGQNFEGGTMKDIVVEDSLSLSSMETLSQ